MRLFKSLTLLLIALVVLRLVVGIGVAWRHYENTPPYFAFINTHPVTTEYLSQQIDIPDPIHSEDRWIGGQQDLENWNEDSDFDLVHQTLKLDALHGSDLMLRLEHKLELALEKDNWDHLGFKFSAPIIETDPAMRAILLIWLDEAATSIGKETAGTGEALFDIFLVAGPGDPEVHYLDLESREHAFRNLVMPLPLNPGAYEDGQYSASFPTWRFFTGITNNLDPLPKEGLLHYLNAKFEFDWSKTSDGYSTASASGPKHYTNSKEYSFHYSMSLKSAIGKSNSGGTTVSSSNTKKWNDKIW